jgi:phosphatidylinositol alpha-1,6-mannosyltransferase
MKRLLVTCEYPPMTGGQGSYLKDLWSGLDATENLLLVPSSCRPNPRSAADGIAYMPVACGESWGLRLVRLFAVFFAMAGHCIIRRPQEIHVGQLMVGGVCALVLGSLFRIPYFVYCYGADVLEFSRYAWARPFIAAVFRNSRRVISISRYTADIIAGLYGMANRVLVINPAVDDRFFIYDPAVTDALRKQYGLLGKKVLLTVGRCVERKGHDTVISALALLRKDHPDIHYLIVGDGPFRGRLEHLAVECGVRDIVTFCGRVPDEELPCYYRLAALFVMVPRLLEKKGDVEGFGIVYIEANAAGLPVVASKSGGTQDAVSDGISGIFVNEPTGAAEVSKAVHAIFSDDKLRLKLSNNAANWARNFSCQSQRKNWLKAIE